MKSGHLKRIAAFTIAAALLLRGPRVETGAQAAASGRLLVLSKGALTLSVVDPVTLRVIGKARPDLRIASSSRQTARTFWSRSCLPPPAALELPVVVGDD